MVWMKRWADPINGFGGMRRASPPVTHSSRPTAIALFIRLIRRVQITGKTARGIRTPRPSSIALAEVSPPLRYANPAGNVGNLLRLGFGLSQIRTGSILAELLLVILGALCYPRAAGVVTAAAQRGRVRPMITAMLIFPLRRNRNYWDDIDDLVEEIRFL